jgi:hypothetical protein
MTRRVLVAGAAVPALLALLMLAALGSRQEGWGGENHTRQVPYSIVDAAYTLIVLAFVAGVIAIVLRTRPSRPRFHPRDRSRWIVAVAIVVFSVLIAVVIVRAHVVDNLAARFGLGAQGGTSGQTLPPDATGQNAHDPQFQWWIAVLAAAGALGFYLWYRRRTRPPARQREELREQLEVVLSETLEDLDAELDPRRAVIRAYARMETVLAAHGLPREPHEAPLEYLARVLRDLRVRPVAAHALTELFERARFSQHEIDVAMKEEAIAALATVRDDLKAAA